jgi:hypothetical protein
VIQFHCNILNFSYVGYIRTTNFLLVHFFSIIAVAIGITIMTRCLRRDARCVLYTVVRTEYIIMFPQISVHLFISPESRSFRAAWPMGKPSEMVTPRACKQVKESAPVDGGWTALSAQHCREVGVSAIFRTGRRSDTYNLPGAGWGTD